jgi:ABC-2 type transport system permease protein
MNRRVLVTMLREYKTTAFTPAFLFGVVLFPALVMGAIFIFGATGVLKGNKSALDGTIAIVDLTPDGVAASALAERYSPEAQRAELERMTQEARQALERTLPPGMASEAQLGMATGMVAGRQANLRLMQLDPSTDAASVRERLYAEGENELLALIVLGPRTLALPDTNADSDSGSGSRAGAGAAAGASEPASPGASSSVASSAEARTLAELADGLPAGVYEFMASRRFDVNVRRRIEAIIGDAVVAHRMAEASIDAKQVARLSQRPAVRAITVTADGQASSLDEFQMFIPMAFMLLLWISVMTGGQYLLMSTIEEKSSRVMEVLLSAISPTELLTGKIIGQGLVALTVLVVYIAMALVSLRQFWPQIFALLPWDVLPWLAVYFVIGFGLFACLMAAIGSAVSDVREAQALLGPIMLLLMFPWFLWYFIVNDPHSVFAMVLSYIPFTTPFVMILRVAQLTDPVPLWQMITTTLAGVAGVLAIGWAAVKIFRIGVLMYGKPPSFMDLLKWLRYG